ncbi:FG-GAP repeat domain-containing protein [Desulfobulbus alkaliphilus]|uniref:FG-GAP repeat domain-containing protein n=1 Tax=Desulfobulbus alkaliphilus TaxID=869814 RepID=UPI001963B04F|nr:VCBS repeat-containing protein [Desulfobulbus alkaliphilus]MBM9537837.1 VCBS repeat-containing protein [Desulfobulbus alkaliphilus]
MSPTHPRPSAHALILHKNGGWHLPFLTHQWLIWFWLSLLVCASWSSAAESDKARVLFLPFSIEIAGPYEHLQNGLPSVLASRLASRANIIAISRTGADDQMAKALQAGEYMVFSNLLRQSEADYLILGALQSTGAGTFELSSYVFTSTPGEPPEKFTLPLVTVDEALTTIDHIAWEISGAVFAMPRPESLITAPDSGDDMLAFQSAHPERAYRQEQLGSRTPGLEIEGQFTLVSSLRGRKMPLQVMDINTSDLNGDGQVEILLLTTNALLLYREMEGQFQKIDEIDLPGYLRYLSVTTADFNENGMAEIFIAGSNNDIPATTILEWNGQNWRTLWTNLTWYLRVMDVGTAPPILLGQKTPSAGSVYEMQLDPSQGVRPLRELALPRGINLYDFAQADITGDGSIETIAIGADNRMRVYNAAGTLLWTSSDIHGASSNFFGTLSSTAQTGRGTDPETVYIKTRIVIQDLDGDGINEVLVGRNRLETVPFMPNLRYFDGASIAAHKWEEGRLVPLWETRRTPGYIVNYQLSPAQEDTNRFELVLVEGEGGSPFFFWRSPSSMLARLTVEVQKNL